MFDRDVVSLMSLIQTLTRELQVMKLLLVEVLKILLDDIVIGYFTYAKKAPLLSIFQLGNSFIATPSVFLR